MERCKHLCKRLLARIMLEIGTDGKHVPDEKKSPLELDIAELVLKGEPLV